MSTTTYLGAKWQSSSALGLINPDLSPVIPRNNPFWGEEADAHVDHSPNMSTSLGSSGSSHTVDADSYEEQKLSLSCDIIELNETTSPKIEEVNNSDEIANLVQLASAIGSETEQFVTIPDEYQLFPKEHITDFNDLCTAFHLTEQSQPILSELNSVDQPSPDLAGKIMDHLEEAESSGPMNHEEEGIAQAKGRRTRTVTRSSSKLLAQMAEDEESLYILRKEEGNDQNHSHHCLDFDMVPKGAGKLGRKRRRNSSEHSVISSCSYDDMESPYKPKRRRYEEEPSDDPAFEKSRKNAIIAKRNREKKKQMMELMESRCDKLTAANDHLEAENIQLKYRVETLEEEIHYMKSILANQSALSNVLSNLKVSDNQLRLSSSFDISKFKKSPRTATAYQQQVKVSGGICLHVDGTNQVSLEMCHKCSQMARGAPRSVEVSGKNARSA